VNVHVHVLLELLKLQFALALVILLLLMKVFHRFILLYLLNLLYFLSNFFVKDVLHVVILFNESAGIGIFFLGRYISFHLNKNISPGNLSSHV